MVIGVQNSRQTNGRSGSQSEFGPSPLEEEDETSRQYELLAGRGAGDGWEFKPHGG
jgi:hypothetical protein